MPASLPVESHSQAGERERLERIFRSLSKRRHLILDLLLSGCPPAEIARHLGISRRTYKAHMRAIADHLEVNMPQHRGQYFLAIRVVYLYAIAKGLMPCLES